MIDTGDLGSAPAPIPAPSPAPVTPMATRLPSGTSVLPWVVMLAAIGFGGYQWWEHRDVKPTPSPVPNVSATEAGKAWGKELVTTFADSFARAQAEFRDTDIPPTTIKADHVTRWKTARETAFDQRIAPLLDTAIAEGNTAPTKAERQKYAELMGQIAEGVREAAK